MRILVDAIIEHIRNQGSFTIACYNELDVDDKNDIIRTVTTYAILLVTGLMGIKAERDGNNMRLESNVPPVLPAQLIAIRHGKFVMRCWSPIATTFQHLGFSKTSIKRRRTTVIF
jgi:hypothetical protein